MSNYVGKKQVLLAVLVLALGLAVYLNYYLASEPNVEDAGTSTSSSSHNLGDSQFVNGKTQVGDDYFSQARRNRSDAHKEAVEVVTEMINNVKATEAVKKEAVAKAAALAASIERESKIENLIKAKGFKDCVVYIEGEKCNIVVKSEALEVQQTLQITEIVTDQSNIVAGNIKISNVNS